MEETTAPSNFLRAIIEEDLATGRHTNVVTRFPPEPNGYLHIGHAKAICVDFGMAADFGGRCHLRFDDTNPEAEDTEYVDAIEADVRWLGFDWGEHLYFASSYFPEMYRLAEQLILDGKAYVDSLSGDEIRTYRGSVTEPGTPSPYRDRSVDENLDLFRRMRAGEFPDGAHVLRAKGDLASPNMKLRDPPLYRIRHAHHHRTGDEWCIYPMYDYAHPLEDALEHVTHSICTLEFDNNRAVYDWVVENCDVPARPRQYEFARLNLAWTMMSKRKLLLLVNEGHVNGWDDPRMPTLAGLRRRGVTPEAIRDFCDRVGVAKANSLVDIEMLEHSIRDDLNHRAPRVLAVLDPLRVVITNFPDNHIEQLDADYWPHDVPKEGSRSVPFTRELFIERADFMQDPPSGFHRLAPGREVRLRYGYFITCNEVITDEQGNIAELRCTYDPETRGGNAPDGRKVKSTLHWVSATESVPVTVRLYDHLFTVPDPAAVEDFRTVLNPDSVQTITGYVEPAVLREAPSSRYQFERLGYFFADPVDSLGEDLVFNRIVTLRDAYAKKLAAEPTQAAAEPKAPKAPKAPKEAKAKQTAVVLPLAPALQAVLDAACEVHPNRASIESWIRTEVLRELKERNLDELKLHGPRLGRLVALIDNGSISSRVAKQVFAEMLGNDVEPEAVVDAKGWRQLNDPAAVQAAVDAVIARHPDELARARDGNPRLKGFFVGKVLAETNGQANPQLVNDLVDTALAAG